MKLLKKLWRWLRPKKQLTLDDITGPEGARKPIIGDRINSGVMYRPGPVAGPITEHLTRKWEPLITPARDDNKVDFTWLGTDPRLPRLPRECPICGGPTNPSKIDDRMVACFACKQVYMTTEAFDDPNIQRDMTHAQNGISCKYSNDNNDCDECKEKTNV